MNLVSSFRMSFFCLIILGLTVMLASCSKKDVVDEPVLSPSVETSADTSTSSSASSATTSDLGAGAALGNELKIVYFEFDRYSIRSDARDALKSNAAWLKQNPSATIQIEGHCDERGTTEYNLGLGERRANAVKDYLGRMGVDKSRMTTISYGEERPANSGHDESAWGENRRAVFVVVSR